MQKMKKCFLDRLRYPYLEKRLAENIVPRKEFINKKRKSKNKESLLVKNSMTFLKGGNRSEKFGGLGLRVNKAVKGIHKRKLINMDLAWSQIDLLEQGSITSPVNNNSQSDTGYLVAYSDNLPRPASMAPLFPYTPYPSKEGLAKQKQGYGEKKWPNLNVAARQKLPVNRITYLYSPFQLEAGASRQQEKPISPLLSQLMERKKLRILYGNLPNREVNFLIKQGITFRGGVGDNLYKLLESRLDVVLCKIGFFSTILEGRQWINHGRVLVNGKPLTIANYLLNPGDIVSIPSNYFLFHRKKMRESFYNAKIQTPTTTLPLSLKVTEYYDLSLKSNPAEQKDKPSISIGHKSLAESPDKTVNLNSLTKRATSEKERWFNFYMDLCKHPLQTSVPQRSDGEKLKNRILPHFLDFLGFYNTHSHPVSSVACLSKKDRLRFFGIKPAHIEVSFRRLTAIYLYPPQRVVVPTIIDINKIRKSYFK